MKDVVTDNHPTNSEEKRSSISKIRLAKQNFQTVDKKEDKIQIKLENAYEPVGEYNENNQCVEDNLPEDSVDSNDTTDAKLTIDNSHEEEQFSEQDIANELPMFSEDHDEDCSSLSTEVSHSDQKILTYSGGVKTLTIDTREPIPKALNLLQPRFSLQKVSGKDVELYSGHKRNLDDCHEPEDDSNAKKSRPLENNEDSEILEIEDIDFGNSKNDTSNDEKHKIIVENDNDNHSDINKHNYVELPLKSFEERVKEQILLSEGATSDANSNLFSVPNKLPNDSISGNQEDSNIPVKHFSEADIKCPLKRLKR
jgi:hypothetical protein